MSAVVLSQVCFDTRNVPDAVNEAPAIARVIFIKVALLCGIFSVMNVVALGEDLSSWWNVL